MTNNKQFTRTRTKRQYKPRHIDTTFSNNWWCRNAEQRGENWRKKARCRREREREREREKEKGKTESNVGGIEFLKHRATIPGCSSFVAHSTRGECRTLVFVAPSQGQSPPVLRHYAPGNGFPRFCRVPGGDEGGEVYR